MTETVDWATRLKESPELLKQVPIELLPELQPVLLSPELSGRYYLFALALIQRADIGTRIAWQNSFRRYAAQFEAWERTKVFSEEQTKHLTLLLGGFVLEFLVPEVNKFGGLRQDCPPVRDELWRYLVDLEEVEPTTPAPVARPAVVRRGSFITSTEEGESQWK